MAAARPAYGLPFVISAASAGTIVEWYDFYLYATLTPFLSPLFFPGDNPTAVQLSGFAAYAAGFLVRPFGAVVFGALGDIIGRKYTFLVTITAMGLATVAMGIIPTYKDIGIVAPTLLVILRLIQGLALGGEYGGAAIYVAEHAPDNKRGLYTSWIQTTATLGFFFALAIILYFRQSMSAADFSDHGWRYPFEHRRNVGGASGAGRVCTAAQCSHGQHHEKCCEAGRERFDRLHDDCLFFMLWYWRSACAMSSRTLPALRGLTVNARCPLLYFSTTETSDAFAVRDRWAS